MRTLYLECNMGAAGDMLMAALYELLEDKQGFVEKMNRLGDSRCDGEYATGRKMWDSGNPRLGTD